MKKADIGKRAQEKRLHIVLKGAAFLGVSGDCEIALDIFFLSVLSGQHIIELISGGFCKHFGPCALWLAERNKEVIEVIFEEEGLANE